MTLHTTLKNHFNYHHFLYKLYHLKHRFIANFAVIIIYLDLYTFNYFNQFN